MFSAHPMLPRVSVLLELSEDPEPPLPPQPARPRRLTPASVPPLNFSMSLLVNLYFIIVPFQKPTSRSRQRRPSGGFLGGHPPSLQAAGYAVEDYRQNH